MKNPVLCFVASLLLACGLLAPAPVAQAKPLQSNGLSPTQFMNADGTLKLDGQLSGTLNLSGWSVAMDPQRGPVFSPAPAGEDSPSVVGPWANLGYGGLSLNGNVYAVAVSGTNVYVGGSFTNADNLWAADYVAMWDGAHWSSLGRSGSGNGSLNHPVLALAVDGSNVYVGGQFTDVYYNSTVLYNADYIAKWNPSTGWSALGDDGAGGGSLNGMVDAIAIMNNSVYVGGTFTDVHNGVIPLDAADYIARWDGSHWHALAENLTGDGSLNGRVDALAVDNDTLYVGGSFTNVDDDLTSLPTADYIAKWNGAQWSALGSNGSGDGALNNAVYALAVDGSGNVYAGGHFTNAGNHAAADYVAEWNGSSWSALGSNGSGNGALNNDVQALAVIGTNVYVGGWFTDLGSAAGDYIAQWNGSSWSTLLNNGAGNGALSDGVLALAASGSNLYVGGAFTKAYNGSIHPLLPAGYAAVWDGAHWAGLSAYPTVGSLNDPVLAIAVSGADIYVGGYFTDVNNNGTLLTAADYIAKWDGKNWSALGDDGSGGGSLNGGVHAIVVSGTDVYVVGDFDNVNDHGSINPAADYVARWDGTHWHALGSDKMGNGSLNKSVYALAMDGSGDLYVGGAFTDVKDGASILTAADYIAMWDGSHWNALGSNGSANGALNSVVFAIATSGQNVYVGGDFTNVKPGTFALLNADYVAKWDGTAWYALGSNGSGNGALNDDVWVLAVDGSGNLYAGGIFTNAASLPTADYIAMWNGSQWKALGSNGSGEGAVNAPVSALAFDSNGNLYVGGSFTNVDNNPAADKIAGWNGTGWFALGQGAGGDGALNHDVKVITVSGKKLYAGGEFFDANNNGSPCTQADYVASYLIPAHPFSVYLPRIVH